MKTKTDTTNVRLHVAKLFDFRYKRLIGNYKELADFVIDEFIDYVKSVDISEEQILQLKKSDEVEDTCSTFLSDVCADAFRRKFFPNFDNEEYYKLFSAYTFKTMVYHLSNVIDREDQIFTDIQYGESWITSFVNSTAFKKDKELQLTFLGYYLSKINIFEIGEETDFEKFVSTFSTPEVPIKRAAMFSCKYCLFTPLLNLYNEIILNSLDPEMVKYYEDRCAENTAGKYDTYIPVHASSVANGGIFIQNLKACNIDNWGARINSAMDYDPRQYKAIPTTEPKISNSFYDENLLYFKNVAFPFFFTYIRSMNFTIDSLEKHSFFYHFGRNAFVSWVIGVPCIIAAFIFFIKMIMMTFGE
jgi:hypothetical protein